MGLRSQGTNIYEGRMWILVLRDTLKNGALVNISELAGEDTDREIKYFEGFVLL